MKYECTYNHNMNTIEVSARGPADLKTSIEMTYRIAEICGQEKSANVLIDFLELDTSFITMGHIAALSRTAVSLQDALKMRKCAYVVARNLEFGFVRPWKTMISTNGFVDLEIRAFKNKGKAIEWVKAGAPNQECTSSAIAGQR